MARRSLMASPPPAAAPWSKPKGLLLDAMGTLITLRESVGTTYAAAAAEHGLAVIFGYPKHRFQWTVRRRFAEIKVL